jgi:anaerobic C4-dicarboxylate transporter DcuA
LRSPHHPFAAVVFAGILEPMGVSYLTLLAICIPVTLIAVE